MHSKLPEHTLFDLTQRVMSRYHDRLTKEQINAVRIVLKEYTELTTLLKREHGWSSSSNYKTISQCVTYLHHLLEVAKTGCISEAHLTQTCLWRYPSGHPLSVMVNEIYNPSLQRELVKIRRKICNIPLPYSQRTKVKFFVVVSYDEMGFVDSVLAASNDEVAANNILSVLEPFMKKSCDVETWERFDYWPTLKTHHFTKENTTLINNYRIKNDALEMLDEDTKEQLQ